MLCRVRVRSILLIIVPTCFSFLSFSYISLLFFLLLLLLSPLACFFALFSIATIATLDSVIPLSSGSLPLPFSPPPPTLSALPTITTFPSLFIRRNWKTEKEENKRRFTRARESSSDREDSLLSAPASVRPLASHRFCRSTKYTYTCTRTRARKLSRAGTASAVILTQHV